MVPIFQAAFWKLSLIWLIYMFQVPVDLILLNQTIHRSVTPETSHSMNLDASSWFFQAFLAQPLSESLALSLPFQEQELELCGAFSMPEFSSSWKKDASLLEAALQAAQSYCKFLHFPLVICSEMHLLEFTKLVSSPSFLHSPAKLDGGICTRTSHNLILEDFISLTRSHEVAT